MEAKINIDENDFFKDMDSLLKDLEERDFQLRQYLNTSFFVLVWFIITTAGIIISLNSSSTYIKSVMWVSICLLILGCSLFITTTQAQILRFDKATKEITNIPSKKTTEELNNSIQKIEQTLNVKNLDIIFRWIYAFCQNLWILAFLIWLIQFIFSLRN